MPVWTRGAESGRDPRALPAEAGRGGARQQRLDPAARHHWRSRRLRQHRRDSRPRPTPRSAARSSSSTTRCRAPRTARATACSARPRRQGRRIASRKGALAIVVRSIGTDHHRNPHTGAQQLRRRRRADPRRRPVDSRRRAAPAHPQARQAGDDAPDPRLRNIGARPVGQRHRRSARPRSQRADPAGRRPSRQLGPRHRRGRRRRRSRDRRRRGEADHGCRPAAADHPHRLVRGRGGRPVRRPRSIAPGTARSRIMRSPRATSAPAAVWKVDSKLGKAREAEARALQAALAPLGIVAGSLDAGGRLRHRPDARRRAARGRAQPGRHALFRPSPHARRHARQGRSGGSCGRTSRRGRRCSRCCRAASSRTRNGASGVKPSKQREVLKCASPPHCR